MNQNRLHNSFVTCLIVVIVSFFNSNIFAQSKLKDTLKIKEVEVRAVKPKTEDKSAEPMQQINRIELDRTTGNTADAALKTFSGVTLKDYGGVGGIKTVNVRSLGANHTGVYVDGVQFSDAANGQVDLGKICTDNASSVSLTVGSAFETCNPARFYASANNINIVSDAPLFDSVKNHFKIAYKTGSYGMYNPSIIWQQKTGKRSFAEISSNYVNAIGSYHFSMPEYDTSGTRTNSDIKSLTSHFRYLLESKDSAILAVQFYWFNSERGLPGAVIIGNPFANSHQRLWNNDLFANISFNNNQKQRFHYVTNVKFSHNYLRYLDPDFSNISGKTDNKYTQQEIYFSQALAYKIRKSFYCTIASDIFLSTLDANLPDYAKPARYSWLTNAGISYKTQRFETGISALESVIHETTHNGVAANDRHILTPSVILTYKIARRPNLSFRFLYKDIFRMPTFNDLYYTLVGNNKLNPERAKQFNAGITMFGHLGILEYFSFKTDGFYNRVSDKIVATPTKNLFVWSMTNIGVVDIRGVEMQIMAQTRKIGGLNYSASCNYTYQEANDITPSSSTYNQQIAYVPFETFNASASVQLKSTTFTYSNLFNGFRYTLPENIYANLLHGWWVSDLSLLHVVNFGKYSAKIKAEISNIFDKQYELITNFPMPGRSFFITLGIQK